MRLLIISNSGIGPILTNAFNYALNKEYEVFSINGSTRSNTNSKNNEFKYFQEISAIIEFVKNFQIDNVLIIASEKSIVKDGILKERLEENGVKVLGNCLKIMNICNHKGWTKRFLRQNNFKVCPGFERKLSDLKNINIDQLNFPLIIKEPVSTGGEGNYTAKDKKDFKSLIDKLEMLDRPDREVLVEEFVSGIECSIEIFGKNGNLQFSPVLYKGMSDIEKHSLDKVRIIPFENYKVREAISLVAKDVSKILNINGVIEIELIWDIKSEVPYIIEINPRLGGGSKLNMIYTSIDTSHLLIDMMDNEWSPQNIALPKGIKAIEIQIKNNLTNIIKEEFKNLKTYKHFMFRKRKTSVGTLILKGNTKLLLADILEIKDYVHEFEKTISEVQTS